MLKKPAPEKALLCERNSLGWKYLPSVPFVAVHLWELVTRAAVLCAPDTLHWIFTVARTNNSVEWSANRKNWDVIQLWPIEFSKDEYSLRTQFRAGVHTHGEPTSRFFFFFLNIQVKQYKQKCLVHKLAQVKHKQIRPFWAHECVIVVCVT